MTRITFFLGILSLTLLYCCKDVNGEEPTPDAPSLSLEVNGETNQTSLEVEVGDTVYLRVTTITEYSMASYSAVYEVNGEQEILEEITPDTSLVEYTTDYEFYVDYTFSGKEVDFTFSVSDTTGASDEALLTLTVAESLIKSVEDIIVSPFNYLDYGNIYDVENDTTYFPANLKTVEANQDGADFIFAFDSELKWMIFSPDDANIDTLWASETGFSWPLDDPGSTRFKVVESTEINFDDVVTSAQLDDLFSDGASNLTSLSVDEVIAFKLDESKNEKIGLIRITQIVGNNSSPRQLTFDLKVQD